VPRTVGYVLDNLKKFPADTPILEIFERRLRFSPS
jgi:hypothetical protein